MAIVRARQSKPWEIFLIHVCPTWQRDGEQLHFVFLFASIHQLTMAPGRPRRLMAGWKFHLVQLTKSFPTDFNYLGPRWNGLLLLVLGVNATKYRKPWPRTDIIVRWPHDCLSPIMRLQQLKPGQTVSGVKIAIFVKTLKKWWIECNLTENRDCRNLFNFPNWYFVNGVCTV